MEHIKYTSDISDVDKMEGLEFEEFCCELFKRNGYTNVRKTPASGDFGLDVIAENPDGIIYGIQCKNYTGSVGIDAVQEAYSGKARHKCDVAIVLTNRTFTKQAMELAQETNVKLWGRNKLIELIKVFPEKKVVSFSESNTQSNQNTPPKSYIIKNSSPNSNTQNNQNSYFKSNTQIIKKDEYKMEYIGKYKLDISAVDNMTGLNNQNSLSKSSIQNNLNNQKF